jgi:hypothetical protein
VSTTWTEAVANAARFHTTRQALWIEGARAPYLRNCRPEGAVVGVVLDADGVAGSGALPTYWNLTDDSGAALAATGLIWEVVDNVWPWGGDGVVVRVHGTPTSTTSHSLNFDARNRIGTGGSDLFWSAGIECALVAGSTTGFTTDRPALFVGRMGTVGGGSLQGGDQGLTALNASALPARVTVTDTFSAAPPRSGAGIRFGVTSGVAVDITLALRWAAMEPRAPTTPVLQKAGVLTTDGVEADAISLALSALGLPATGAGTYLWGGIIPQAAPAGANQTLFQIDDGDDDDRIVMRVLAGGSTLDLARVAAAASASASSLGSMVAGTPFACGLTLDGAGRAFAIRSSGTGQEVTGAPASGLTTLRFGNSVAGTTPLNGGITLFQVSASVLSDSALAAQVNGLVP